MGLDIRIPIGAMFAILGALLMVYGFLSDPSLYQRSLGMNVNLWWGIVLLAFGLIMLWLAKMASGRNKTAARQ
jgi:protein-S-isoprenylcysteine O-methyltransferase Ste14